MGDDIEERVQQRSDEDNLKVKICQELKKIWRVALPSIISRVFSFGILVVTQSFIGHVNSVDLAAYSLVQILLGLFVDGILLGMSSAAETLCGQAYGAKQYHMMGIFLQRSWLVELATVTMLLPIYLFGTPILKLFGQDPLIAKSAGTIARWFIPISYARIFIQTIQMYLQAQQKNAVIAYLSVLQLAVHVFLSWIFVYVLKWGVSGAMGAAIISLWLLVVGEFIYIFCGWCPDSWHGFSVAALKDIIPIVKLSISSGFMLCLELWYFAILVLVAGYTKNVEAAISAFSICLNINWWEFMICLGFFGATCVRVSNELGRGNAKAVKFSIKTNLCTSFTIGLTFCIFCLIFGNRIGHLFSKDEAVVKSISDLSLLLSFSMLLNSIFPVFTGAAIGTGLQARVAIINIICYYIIGLPVGILLGYVAHLQVKGIWIGMLGGIICQTLAIGFMIWRTDWDDEVLKTSKRLKKWYLKSPNQSEHDSERSTI